MTLTLLNTALLGLIGAIAFALRDVPVMAALWLSRHVLSRLTVDSRDRFLFTTLVEYLESRPGFAASNQITAHSRRLGEDAGDSPGATAPFVHLSPAPGFHIFRDQGRWLMIHRQIEVSQTVLERVTLMGFGRDPAWLRGLVDQALTAREDAERDHLSIHAPDPYEAGQWTRVRLGQPRPLDSVVLQGGLAQDLRADLARFLDARTDYQRLGLPWRRGYLLFGPPGTGKTSVVAALASDLRMSICTLSLAGSGVSDDKIHALLAAVPRRSILLIEDVDAFFDDRDAVHDEVKLSFSGFLNALDGVATQEGFVIFMTTNHPERLDPALIRLGRIDRRIELGLADADQIGRLYARFDPDPVARDAFVAAHRDKRLSPADVQGLLLRRFLAPEAPPL